MPKAGIAVTDPVEVTTQLPITVDVNLDEAARYGTTRQEYRLWVDYVFDWFGATLERRFRRYLVAALAATVVWLICLLILVPFNFAGVYVRTLGVYLFWIGVAWCINALRWLSQTYHIRTNRVRPCFEIDDDRYKAFVSPFAARATQNWQILFRSLPYMAITWIYIAAVMFGSGTLRSVFLLSFPSSFSPAWHSGAYLLPKMLVMDILFGIAIFHAYTGVRLTLSTSPLYKHLAGLPVIPLPGLVRDLFQGVVQLYQSGAFMWSFGILLVELLYQAQLDIIGGSIFIAALSLAVVAFLQPRIYVAKIYSASIRQAEYTVLTRYYSHNRSNLDARDLAELNQFVRSFDEVDDRPVSLAQLLNLFGSQTLSLAGLVFNTLIAPHIPLGSFIRLL